MSTTQAFPSKGQRYTVHILTGYRTYSSRPLDCRMACQCGACNGVSTRKEGTVEDVVYYADNSVEVRVRTDDGDIVREMLVAPHGDVC